MHSITALQNKNESNILGSSLVSQDYIIDKLRGLKANTDIVRLEVEDMVSSQTHAFMLPMVQSLIVLDERNWEQLKFTDFITIEEYNHYSQAKHEMIQNYATIRVCSGNFLRDLISFEVSIQVEEEDEVSKIINLLQEMKQDPTISEFVFPEKIDYQETKGAETVLISKRFTMKAVFNGSAFTGRGNANSIGRSIDALIAKLGEQLSERSPDTRKVLRSAPDTRKVLRSDTLPFSNDAPARMPLRRTFSSPSRRPTLTTEREQSAERSPGIPEVLRSSTSALPRPKASSSRRPLRRILSNSSRRPTLPERHSSFRASRPTVTRAPLRRNMSCSMHKRNEASSDDNKSPMVHQEAPPIESNRNDILGRSLSTSASDHARVIPVQHVVESAPPAALAAASCSETKSDKFSAKPDYNWETGRYCVELSAVAAHSA